MVRSVLRGNAECAWVRLPASLSFSPLCADGKVCLASASWAGGPCLLWHQLMACGRGCDSCRLFCFRRNWSLLSSCCDRVMSPLPTFHYKWWPRWAGTAVFVVRWLLPAFAQTFCSLLGTGHFWPRGSVHANCLHRRRPVSVETAFIVHQGAAVKLGRHRFGAGCFTGGGSVSRWVHGQPRQEL